MRYERKRRNEDWLPVIGANRLAWIEFAHPDIFQMLEAGQTITDPLNPKTQYRLRNEKVVG